MHELQQCCSMLAWYRGWYIQYTRWWHVKRFFFCMFCHARYVNRASVRMYISNRYMQHVIHAPIMLSSVSLVHMLKHTISILLTCRAKLLMYVLVCNIMYTLLRLTLHIHCRKEVNETNERRSTYSSFNWASPVAASCSSRMKMKAWNWCMHDENQIQNEKLYPWHDWVWWRIERCFHFLLLLLHFIRMLQKLMFAWMLEFDPILL